MWLNDIGKSLLNSNRYEDLYILSRYMYKTGRDIMDDEFYNKLETTLMKSDSYKHLQNYFDTTYDDDTAPLVLLDELRIEVDQEDLMQDVFSKYELASVLNTEKSRSIDSVYELEHALEYFITRRNLRQDIMLSLKVDGLNNKILYYLGRLYADISRARDTTSKALDYMLGAKKVLPWSTKLELEKLKIFGEAYVDEDYLPMLRTKYNSSRYKTPRGSAKSLLVRPHDDEDLEHLRIKIFKAEGIADTYVEMFKLLEDNGFDTVPHLLIKWEDIPEDNLLISDWIVKTISYFEEYTYIPSDGVVCDINDMTVDSEIKGKYDYNQMALKFGYWKALKYSGIVKDIKIEQQRVYASVRVEIEPIVAKDNATLTFIDCKNVDILLENNITVGSSVMFERDSGTITKLIRNK